MMMLGDARCLGRSSHNFSKSYLECPLSSTVDKCLPTLLEKLSSNQPWCCEFSWEIFDWHNPTDESCFTVGLTNKNCLWSWCGPIRLHQVSQGSLTSQSKSTDVTRICLQRELSNQSSLVEAVQHGGTRYVWYQTPCDTIQLICHMKGRCKQYLWQQQ